MLIYGRFLQILSSVVLMATMFSGFVLPSASAQGKDGLKRQFNIQTGKVSFIGPDGRNVLPASQALGIASLTRPADPAMALAKRYGPEFGLSNPERDLTELKSQRSENGRISIRYQQNYQGIPVIGGELIVNTNENGDLYSINGEISAELSFPIQVTIDAQRARQMALNAMGKWYQMAPEDFLITEPELWIFDEGLLQPSTRSAELVWRMEATSKDPSVPVREFILVNAKRGNISLHFNQIDTIWGRFQKTSGALKKIEEDPNSRDNPTSTNSTVANVPPLAGAAWYVATAGSDSNSCSSTGSPCKTINAAIGKAASGDIIKIASGTYTGTGDEVVLIDKSVTLSGGWDANFTSQSGQSIINGQEARWGVTVNIGVTAVIERCTIQNGKGTPAGIFNWGSLTLNNSIISNNDGAGIQNNGAVTVLTVNNSIIHNNKGSGISNGAGTVTVNNSTISGNTAAGGGGGGLLNYGTGRPTTTVNNSTITGNTAAYGGGINRSDGIVTLKNTIVAGNVDTFNGPDCVGLINSAGYNLIGDTTECEYTPGTGDLINIDPQLGELMGSPGYYPLKASSPAINAGNPAAPGSGGNACLANDIRGVTRPGGVHCDIGAYEYTTPGSPTRLSILSGDNQHVGPGLAFPKPLKVVVLDGQNSPVPNISITFTAPGSGASGIFAGSGTRITTMATDAGGVVTTSIFTANSVLGSYTVIASASGLASVNFNLRNGFWHVAPTGSDTNDCKTPATSCATINAAIGNANEGDTIRVAAGTYTGTATEVVLIKKSITLSGGWNAGFTTQSGRSIIDAQGGRRGIMAIGTDSTSVALDRFSINNGFHDSKGGGIYNEGSTLTLTNSLVNNNLSLWMGGGIYNMGPLVITNTSINNNIAGDPCCFGGGGGAGIQNYSGTFTLNNSSVSNNLIMGDYIGSGINTYDTVILNNSTISGNSGGSGEGVYIWQGALILNNSTISGNQSYGVRNQGGTVTLRNTIVAGNGNEGDCYNHIDYGGTVTSQGYNLIGNSSGCGWTSTTGDLVNVNPSLGQLVGSPGYLPLLAGSQAINTGNPATPGSGGNACLPTDQRGVARPSGGRCDIGAYEYNASGSVSSLFIVSGNGQRSAPTLSFSQALRVAALDSQGNPVSNVNVTFTAPASGASGSFANTGTRTTTVITDSKGVATAPVFTANASLGAYNVTASTTGAGSVNFSLQNFGLYVATTGNDANSCLLPSSPCATIQAAINKAAVGDSILIAAGRYTSTNFAVVNIDRGMKLSGGWNAAFTTQTGLSTIDGQNARRGVHSYMDPSMSASIDRFLIENGTQSEGGGISNPGAGINITISNSVIRNNSATSYNGGGIYNNGNLTLNNTTVSNNSASYGGGIDNYPYGNLILNNSTVSNNSAFYGAGIYNEGDLTFNNTTISDNSATYGGGIYNLSTNGSDTLKNSILARNTGASSGPDCYGALGSSGYNLIGISSGCTFSATTGDKVGTSASPINPVLTPLQDNSGLTSTHALMAGSPALDAGNPATPGGSGNACLATDQRGTARPVGTRCDIGAYEGSVALTPLGFVNTYTTGNTLTLPGTFLCSQTDPNCAAGDSHAKAAHKHAIGTYNLYATQHGRDSIDNNGMTIVSSVHYNTGHANAFWNGEQIVYGDAYGYPLADDVVAHELTHGVTQYESNLFYYYQSGAINESLSDLWGEYYDQNNGQGTDTSSVKWQMGEDVSGLGTLRSMSNPTLFGDPDKISSINYYTGADDNGGVHTNSGVNNKAAYLMVEGGSFNSKTVTALGWDKTAAIYYEANANLLSSGADYSDLYYALQQACTNLIGQKGITSANCLEVKDAIDAVEMNGQPVLNFNTEAPYCDSGNPTATIFSDDLESGTGNWSFNNGSDPRWQWDSPYGPYAHSGNHFLYADDFPATVTDATAKLKSLSVPGNAYLHFAHAYDFEVSDQYYDGGVLEYSIDNGTTWQDAVSLIDFNGYKGTIFTGADNPLSGRSAFVGSSHGYISTRLNLASLAGKTVAFRWRMGLDQAAAAWGWWVDDVKLYQCTSSPVGLGTYDDTHMSWVYSNGMGSWSDSNLSGGSAHYSDVVGRSAEFSFTGSQFVLKYTGYNNRGTLDVYIDGNPTKVATINEYNPLTNRVYQSRWTSGNLGAGAHTVKFVHASGSIVDIDGIEIRNYQAPPGTGTYDDTHAGWAYGPGVVSWSNLGLSGGSAHYSDVVGRYAEFSFTGSQFVLYYTGYNNRGTLDVYIDGNPTKVATINEYNPLTNRVYQSRWTSGNLGAGAHTVKFVHASGSIVDIDGIEIRNYQAPPGTGTYDDTHAGWAYGPGVVSWSNPGLSGGSAHYSDVVGRSAEFSFTGSQFVLYYTGYNNRGTLDVYVDNAYVGTINQYNPLPDRVFQSTWTSGNLGAGAHTVKFVHASGSIVDIDGIEIRNYTPPGVGVYDDTHMSWVYSNGMGSWSDGNLSGGTAHYSDVVGRSAEFSFTGSQFVLKYTGYNNRGTLDVYIDGNPTKVATINEYNPLTNRVYQSRWTSGNLGAGAHTVKFVHASGSIVDIDGIEIRNYQAPPGTGTYDDTHAGWAYGPGVVSWSNPGLSGGSAHYSDVVGRYAEFSFTGPQFVLYYTGYNNRGTLDVYVDNVYVGTINQYNPLPDRVFQSQWASGNLGAGSHTVTFVHASGSIIDFDAVTVMP